MYLEQVLKTFASDKKPIGSDDIYKLNEAVFNLEETVTVDQKLTAKLFRAILTVQKAYVSGRFDTSDGNFFYDYAAMLGTMQNQHFFTQKQHQSMLTWLAEAVGAEIQPPPAAPAPAPKPTAKDTKAVASLEAENARLKEELAKLQGISNAVVTIQSWKMPEAATEEKKAKGKSKDRKKRNRSKQG
mmetsp:Transcript_22933/g.41646  ORF Transcript_22933/g.41646 Transcript_22933/m.41646 type:complete len:186 (+) Transcript_22933:107-664(+)